MTTRRGAFIIIEGTDGSGKGTQFQLLKDRLVAAGYKVESFDFPQYNQPSSHFVTQYLNGAYGSVDEVGPYTASLFYALDRYEAAPRIRRALDEGSIVLCNRFTGSSMAHQGTKFRSTEERRGYFIWLDNLEFEMLHIPRPDISFVLRVPADIAEELVIKKEKRAYTDKARDIHEASHDHQKQAVAVYDDLTQLFPKDFQRVDCVRGGKLLDIGTIQAMLWEKVSPLLPQPAQLEMAMSTPLDEATPAASVATAMPVAVAGPAASLRPDDPHLDAVAIQAEEIRTELDVVIEAPEAAVTNPDSNIYAFTAVLEPVIVAAVVASLGQGGGELSIRVLQEFAEAARKDTGVLRRTITYYGDESVRQLVNTHVVIAGASGLLASVLEQGRMAAYVEPRVRHLRYDQKDSNGFYRYYMPLDIPEDTAITYRKHIDRIFDLYTQMLPTLAAHLQEQSGIPAQGRSAEWQAAMEYEAREVLQAVLPLAASTTVAVYASAQSFENLLVRLAANTLPEANSAGVRVHQELQKIIPAYMDVDSSAHDDKSTYRRAVYETIGELANAHLPASHAAETEAVRLTYVWPRNELDLVADMLYEYSDLPLHAIQRDVAAWPYARKLDAFEAYIGTRTSRRLRPGRALEKARYSWDLICDYTVMHELLRHRIVDNPAMQTLTPRHGYEVPATIEAAGLADEFEACFDTSLKLYSILQQAGYPQAAQYATLRGHKQRWQITYNAREAFHIHELHSTPSTNARLRAYVEQLHAKLAEVHPLLAEAMAFAGNTDAP
jgi:dTMP kinase